MFPIENASFWLERDRSPGRSAHEWRIPFAATRDPSRAGNLKTRSQGRFRSQGRLAARLATGRLGVSGVEPEPPDQQRPGPDVPREQSSPREISSIMPNA
jgi:hypothetical protein